MTVPAWAIAPDERLGWTVIHAQADHRQFGALRLGWGSPARCFTDPSARVTITAPHPGDLATVPATVVAGLARDCTSDPLTYPAVGIAVLLAVFDHQFRQAGLISGNVYLASTSAVAAIIDLVGWSSQSLSEPSGLDAALQAMFHAELLYQFPVALKFRGSYGHDRQLRLNCWGRRLAETLCATAMNAAAAEASERITAHLTEFRELYRQHMDLISHLDPAHPGAAWQSATRLPVGILI